MVFLFEFLFEFNYNSKFLFFLNTFLFKQLTIWPAGSIPRPYGVLFLSYAILAI
jgi:hypothetical protein